MILTVTAWDALTKTEIQEIWQSKYWQVYSHVGTLSGFGISLFAVDLYVGFRTKLTTFVGTKMKHENTNTVTKIRRHQGCLLQTPLLPSRNAHEFLNIHAEINPIQDFRRPLPLKPSRSQGITPCSLNYSTNFHHVRITWMKTTTRPPRTIATTRPTLKIHLRFTFNGQLPYRSGT